MLQKINNLYLGLAVGIILPLGIFFIFRYPKISYYSLIDGNEAILKALPLLLTQCIFPNALIFFLLTWKNLLHAAKGILISTAVLTGLLVIINFVL